MNKKGFTLIEIIICLSLISLIAVISIMFFQNRNKLVKTTDLILESAQVYIDVEKNEEGKTYREGLFSGGTALSIPLTDLENKGYINDNIIKTLEKEGISKDNYILAAVFSDSKDYCTDSESVIMFEASWDEKLKEQTVPIYLCKYNKSISNINNEIYDYYENYCKDSDILNKYLGCYIINKSKNKVCNLSLDENDSIDTPYCNINDEEAKNKFKSELANTNGMPSLLKETESYEYKYGYSYYFRGNVKDNYLNFLDSCWRIVRITSNGDIKIILADSNNKCDEGYKKSNYTSGLTSLNWDDPCIIDEEGLFSNQMINGYLWNMPITMPFFINDNKILTIPKKPYENVISLYNIQKSNGEASSIEYYNYTKLSNYSRQKKFFMNSIEDSLFYPVTLSSDEIIHAGLNSYLIDNSKGVWFFGEMAMIDNYDCYEHGSYYDYENQENVGYCSTRKINEYLLVLNCNNMENCKFETLKHADYCNSSRNLKSRLGYILKSNVNFTGEGTLSNPYEITSD